MAIYLTHPEHGTHICYSEHDAQEHEKIGWSRNVESKQAELSAPVHVEPVAPVVKRGRKPRGQ